MGLSQNFRNVSAVLQPAWDKISSKGTSFCSALETLAALVLWLVNSLDCSQSPYFSVGFSRQVRFDGTAAILVCKSERDLGRVSKLPRGAGLPSVVQTLSPDRARFYKPRWRQLHRSIPVSRIPRKNRGTVNSL